MNKIRIGILGYGNLGRGVEQGILQNKDMELVGFYQKKSNRYSAYHKRYKVIIHGC